MKCPYVLMISPKLYEFDSNLDIVQKLATVSDGKQFAITAKDTEDGDRYLYVTSDTKRFLIQVIEDGSLLINGEEIIFEGTTGLLPLDLQGLVEVMRFPRYLYKIHIIPLNVNLYYNGKRVQIEVGKKRQRPA